MAEEVGRILVISFASNMPSMDAIKRIHGDGELPQPIASTQHLEAYPWTIKNKYFTVDVHLCHARSLSITSLLVEETSHLCFEAIIIIFDQQKRETLKDASDCMKFLESHNASVHLLLNAGKDETTSEQGLLKTEVLEWCLKFSFELVEMNPDDDDQQEAGEFGEQTGFPRVIQALNCGEWANIELKGSKKDTQHSETSTTDDAKSCAQSQTNQQNTPECKTDEEKSVKNLTDCSGLTVDESELLRRIGQEDTDGESFEELFTKLRDMKDHASTLPDEQRKSYAEKVAIAFWRAMGGEDDEIADLND